MIKIIRTNAADQRFHKLVSSLNAELAERDGADHPLSQFNSISPIKHVVLACENDQTIGCGALAAYDSHAMEIKRMYVVPHERGNKIGAKLLCALEKWTKELGGSKCLLFTGTKQPEANKLYQRKGYQSIQKYGKLAHIADCQCFAKEIGE